MLDSLILYTSKPAIDDGRATRQPDCAAVHGDNLPAGGWEVVRSPAAPAEPLVLHVPVAPPWREVQPPLPHRPLRRLRRSPHHRLHLLRPPHQHSLQRPDHRRELLRRPCDLELGGEIRVHDVPPLPGGASRVLRRRRRVHVQELVAPGDEALGALPSGSAHGRVVPALPQCSSQCPSEIVGPVGTQPVDGPQHVGPKPHAEQIGLIGVWRKDREIYRVNRIDFVVFVFVADGGGMSVGAIRCFNEAMHEVREAVVGVGGGGGGFIHAEKVITDSAQLGEGGHLSLPGGKSPGSSGGVYIDGEG